MRRWFPVLLALLLFSGAPARADVGIDIHLGNTPAPPPPPPAIEVESSPEMVFAPEIGLYVAVGIPDDIVYVSGRYYRSYSGGWYRSRYYDGPWVFQGQKQLPRGLRQWNIEKIHQYRDMRGQQYKEQGPKYQGKHFTGKRNAAHAKSQGNHPGK